MTTSRVRLNLAMGCLAPFVALAASLPLQTATAAEASQPFLFAADPVISAQQHDAYDVVHRYELMLNAGDTGEVLKLFAPDSVAEWNDKPTFKTLDEKAAAYNALFKIAKFATVFGYAAIDVSGDMAVVRTYHHEGAAVFENGKEVLDLNREIFVLRRVGGEWKIVLYAFNTNLVQGEG